MTFIENETTELKQELNKNDNNHSNNLTQEEIIINYLKSNTKITRQDVEKVLNIGNTRSKQIINKLLQDDFLTKEGSRKNTYYVLK